MKHLISKFVLFLFIVVTTTNLVAQVNTEWTYTDSTASFLKGITTDSENNIIYSGYNSDTALISKLNQDGTLAWTQTFEDYNTISSIIFDSEGYLWAVASPGNVLLKLRPEGSIVSTTTISSTASFTNRVFLTAEGDILTTSSVIDSSWLVSRFNSAGEVIWSQLCAPAEGGDFYIPRGIAEDSNGNIIVVGEMDDFNTCMVLKLDQQGNEIWSIQAISHPGSVQNVVCDSEDNIIITGTNQVASSYYVIKLDQDGESIWTNSSDEEGTSFGLSMLSDGTIITAGDLNESIWVGDSRVSAYDQSGNSLWTSTLDLSSSETWFGMTIDSNDAIICIGVKNNLELEEDEGFIAKFALNNGLEIPQNVTADNELALISWNAPENVIPTAYNVYLDGVLIDTVTELSYTFEGLTTGQTYMAGVSALYNDEESSIAVIEITYTVTANEENCLPTATLLGNYPNPFNPTTTIAFSTSKYAKVSVDIFNIKGQKVKSLINNELSAGNHSIVWNGKNDQSQDVGSGVYYYKVKMNNTTKLGKMVLMK